MSNKKPTKPDAGDADPALPSPYDPALDPARAPTQEKDFDAHAFDIDARADEFALAILRNPNVAQLLYGDPLQPHRCGDHPSVGAYLAYTCRRLATDYYEALKIEREIQRLAERS